MRQITGTVNFITVCFALVGLGVTPTVALACKTTPNGANAKVAPAATPVVEQIGTAYTETLGEPPVVMVKSSDSRHPAQFHRELVKRLFETPSAQIVSTVHHAPSPMLTPPTLIAPTLK